jgi:general secretion pathway protein J
LTGYGSRFRGKGESNRVRFHSKVCDWRKPIENDPFPVPSSRESGFTLIEVIVAAALLGLLSVVLFGGISVGVRVMDSVAHRSDVSSQLGTVQDFLRNQLAQAQPMIAEGKDERRPLMFEGRREGVDFVALAPAYLPVGGYQVLSISFDTRPNRNRLVALWRPFMRWAVDRTSQAPADRESLLLDHLAGAEFSYFGSPDGKSPAAWHEEWRIRSVLPSLVRLRVRPKGGQPVQEFVVAPRLAENLS